MSGPVLRLNQISKSYREYSSQRRRLLSWFGLCKGSWRDHWVLRDISFEVLRGEALGIVGVNGAGKSTLLRIIAGTLSPTMGQMAVAGKVSAILELSMGFNYELTARANALHACGLMGHGRAQILETMSSIEEFAEIGEYFDQPLRTFSSGMQMRLAFAVATAFRPEILIIDEALAVGDAYFQHKCIRRICNFKELGTTLLFVSHDPEAVRTLCERALLIENGQVVRDADAASVMDYYRASQVQRWEDDNATESDLKESDNLALPERESKVVLARKSVGGILAEVSGVSSNIRSGDRVSVRISAELKEESQDPHIGFGIRTRLGIVVYETNTYTLGHKTRAIRRGETLTVDFSFTCDLYPGTYELMVGLADSGFGQGSFERALFFDQSFLVFEVVPGTVCGWQGISNLHPEVSVL